MKLSRGKDVQLVCQLSPREIYKKLQLTFRDRVSVIDIVEHGSGQSSLALSNCLDARAILDDAVAAEGAEKYGHLTEKALVNTGYEATK